MKIAGIQKLSMVDYPGKMACTVFLSGCNFRCPYCHNSSLVIPEPDQSYLSEEEVLKFLKKRQGILDGVCITGGEPLLQGEAVISFMRKVKELGYSLKLDTNGTNPKLLKELCEAGLVDYVAMDIKNSKENYHVAIGREKEDCGKLLENVRESASYLMNGRIDYEFRTTLVKGIHTPQDVEDIVFWIGKARIWYLQNFKDSGSILSPNLVNMEPFSENELELFANTANESKLNTVVRNV